MKRIFFFLFALIATEAIGNPVALKHINEVQTLPIPRVEVNFYGSRVNHWEIKSSSGTLQIQNIINPPAYYILSDTNIIGNFILNPSSDSIVLIDTLGYRVDKVTWPGDFNPPAANYSTALYSYIDSFYCFDPYLGLWWWETELYYAWHNNWPPSFGFINPASPSAIELSQFSAQSNANGVKLLWYTESESDNYQWIIERSTEPTSNYSEVARMPAQSGGNVGANYSYKDKSVLANSTYYYRLGDQDKNGDVTWHGPVHVSTKAQGVGSPASSGLTIKAFPNPARAQTILSYAVPLGEGYNLKLYDLSGRLVKNLDQGKGMGGYINIQWHGDNEDQKAVSAGNYLAILSSGGQKITQKITWLK